MAEEPTLPRLPVRVAPTADDFRPSKRVRLHSTSPPVSSDPPFFSSDDDPAAENYSVSHDRQKRRFRGPWFSQRPDDTNGKKEKRTLQRQFDSAVWLGSDATDGDDDADFADGVQLRTVAMSGLSSGITRPSLSNGQSTQPPREPSAEELAAREIESCLEAGREDIDLSTRGLTRISNATIRPLATIVAIPRSSQGLSYHPLRPKLKLFLSSNALRRVPGEIFNLDNVTVLSLRSNLLVDLPSAIGRLKHLVEFNVANNNLHYLPYEVLDIFSADCRLHSLTWHPNPFYEPDTADKAPYKGGAPYPPDLRERDGIRPWTGRPEAVLSALPIANWNLTYKFRSHVRFMRIDGTLVKGPEFPRDESLFSSPLQQRNIPTYAHHFTGTHSNLIPIAPPDDIPESPSLTTTKSKAPSLLEVALKSWSHSPLQLDMLADYDLPERLARVMDDAKVLRETEADERYCTICKRSFIIPRTEWIEWWQISKVQDRNAMASAASPLRHMENRRDQVESMVPLMRRGCSWSCLPDRTTVGDAE